MKPFLFLLYIAYLTPPSSGRSIISQYSKPTSPQSYEAPPEETHSRSKRSLTAFLAAEVLFLEGLLAAQNSRKPRKISRPVLVNTIDSRVKVKQNQFVPAAHPSPQLFHFRPKPPPAPTVPTTTVSSLDPFVMLSAPDLSKNKYGEFGEYQLHQNTRSSSTPAERVTQAPAPTFHAPQGSFTARKPRKRTLHYGAFELYHL